MSEEVRALVALLTSERRRKGWSAAKLGRAVSEAGHPMTRMTVANVESGRVSRPSLDYFLACCRALGLHPGAVLTNALPACEACKGSAPSGFTCNTCGIVGHR